MAQIHKYAILVETSETNKQNKTAETILIYNIGDVGVGGWGF